MGAHWAPISACNNTTGNLWCLNYCFKVYIKVIANKVTILNVYALVISKYFMMFSCNSKSIFLKFTNQGWFSRWRHLFPSLTTWVQFPFWKQRKNNLHIPQRNKTKVAQQDNSFCKKGAARLKLDLQATRTGIHLIFVLTQVITVSFPHQLGSNLTVFCCCLVFKESAWRKR